MMITFSYSVCVFQGRMGKKKYNQKIKYIIRDIYMKPIIMFQLNLKENRNNSHTGYKNKSDTRLPASLRGFVSIHNQIR